MEGDGKVMEGDGKVMEGDGKVGELESGTLCKVDAHMWSRDSPSGLNKIHNSGGRKALLSL